MELLTIKDKLKKDLKFVLNYQMITGDSLKNIPAAMSFQSMQDRMDSKTPGLFNYYKRKEYTLDKDFSTLDEVYNDKDLKIFKALKNNPIDEFIIKFVDTFNVNNRHTECNSIDELVNFMLDNNLLTNECRLVMNIHRSNRRRTLDIEVHSDFTQSPRKLLNHLKTDIKTVLQYNLSGFGTASEIFKFKTSLTTMKHKLRNRYDLGNYKKIDNIYDLLKIDVDGLQNHVIKLTLLDGLYNEFQADEELDTYQKIIDYVNKREREGAPLRSQWLMLRKDIFHLENDGAKYDCIEHQTLIELVFDDIEYEMGEKSFSKYLPEFKGYTFTHGLMAFNDYMKLSDKINSLKNNKITICCCWDKEYIGYFGVYVQGDCIHASLYDLSSRYDDESGERTVDSGIYYQRGSITSPKEIIMTEDMNGEALVKNFRITGIWVRRSYFRDSKNYSYKMMNIMAIRQQLGEDLPIKYIDDRDNPDMSIYHGNKFIDINNVKSNEIRELRTLY